VLLSKLFGTQLYDAITAELDRRRAAAIRQRQDAEAAIDAATSAAAEAAGLDAEARASLLELPGPRAGDPPEAGGRGPRADRGRSARKDWRWRPPRPPPGWPPASERQQARLMARLTEALSRLREHEDSRPQHDQRAARLAAARSAEPVRPLLAA